MPEYENLEVQSGARSSYRPKREDQRNDDGEHESSLFDAERNFNSPTVYDVSGRHTQQTALASRSHWGSRRVPQALQRFCRVPVRRGEPHQTPMRAEVGPISTVRFGGQLQRNQTVVPPFHGAVQ
jgi:hypothetical protein